MYIIGSHFGPRRRGLQRKRAFVARFAEQDIALGKHPAVELQVAHNEFRLHRAINDALRPWLPQLLDLSSLGRRSQARVLARRTTQEAEPHLAQRISHDDWPINIEGLAFRANGTALLGLRFPVDRQGHPFIVEIERFTEVMFGDAPLIVGPVWVLQDIGTPARPAGIRDVESDPGTTTADAPVSLIVGGIGGEFAVDDDERSDQRVEHWQTTIPTPGGGVHRRRRASGRSPSRATSKVSRCGRGVGFAYIADSMKNAVIWFDRRDAHNADQ